MFNQMIKLFEALQSGRLEPIGLSKRIDVTSGFCFKEEKITLTDRHGRLVMKKTTINIGEGFEYFYTSKETKNNIKHLLNEI